MNGNLTKRNTAALKGVAILLMVFHHCYRSADKFAGYEVNFQPFSQEFIINIGVLSKICVSIFAFVSGYGLLCGYKKVMERNSVDRRQWIARHIVSTLSGFWLVAVCCYIAYRLLGIGDFSNFGNTKIEKLFYIAIDILGFSGLMDTPSLNTAWWYIGTAVAFILLLPVCKWIADRMGYGFVLAMVFLIPRILGLGFLGGRSTWSFLFIFVCGMMCSEGKYGLYINKGKYAGIINFLIYLVVFILGGWLSLHVSIHDFWELKYGIVPLAFIFLCTDYLFRIPFLQSFFAFLGRYSLNVWLIHTFIRDWLGTYIWKLSFFWLVPLVILGISLGISMLIEGLKKQIKYEQWFVPKTGGKNR